MLNVLSGYTSASVTLKVNQTVASQKAIRFKSSYIMQEYNLHKFLTVQETMNFAINLKVGKRLSIDRRHCKVRFTQHILLNRFNVMKLIIMN